ncbi:MAG TPA: DNA polymerase III subunit alpha, partial [Candidatus Hydrogenedentes bacterium]|nr:DNA polymerase III subunit alpha [Candidatus Hydrogenedentota bacterium]
CRMVTAYRLDEAFKLVDWPPSEHVFVLSDNQAQLEALQARGAAPLAAITYYGDARSRYEAGRLRQFASERGLRPVAVNPVYFLDQEHARIHQLLSAIRRNTTVDALVPGDVAHPAAWFRSPEAMAVRYADWPETLANIEWVVERCHLDLTFGRPLFPAFDLPEDETPYSFLWKRTFEGVVERYRSLTPQLMNRLSYELDVIRALGFAPYFLIVWEIVNFARRRSIPIVGRGSAANSLAAYALGITRVDPLKYDLYFERFLNLSRTDCPDIDLDICWRRRDQVVDYVYERYGHDRVAMIASLNTFKAHSAVREVAKAFGLTDDEIGPVTRRLPHYRAQDIRTVVKHLPECRGLRFDEEPWKSVLEISEFIDGFPRHLSMHPCGLVIAPEPLTCFTPLERAAKGLVITQYEMYPIEDLGLVKIDLLGHRSLTVIDETVAMVREKRGIDLDIEALPDPDPLTADLIRRGDTIGCFQIESPAMRALLQHTLADGTDLLIKTLSLVRPGPSGSGMKKLFIDRHLGKEETDYLHPALEAVLGDTYGIMLYQEDILKVASVIAGMDLAEGDSLRRAM